MGRYLAFIMQIYTIDAIDNVTELLVDFNASVGELASELARFAGFESIAQSIEIHALTSDPDVTALL